MASVDAVPLTETTTSAPSLVASEESDRRKQRDSRSAQRVALSRAEIARAHAVRKAKAKRAAAQRAASAKKAAQHKAAHKALAEKRAAAQLQRKRAAAAAARAKAKRRALSGNPRSIARQLMRSRYGWGESQYRCYNKIIMRESAWKVRADNPSSSAYGIPQALPGSKMRSAGSDWRTNPATQITWGLGYVKSRYGTPCSAWGFKSSHGWY
jgi:hypothetical protein